MNSRLLGIMCMVGGAVMIVATFAWGAFTKPTIADILFGAGGISGLVGLIRLGALGESPVSRALGFVPILGFALLIVGEILQLAGIIGDDSALFGVAWMMLLAGMVLVGILVIAAKRWRGWRRFAPLLTILFAAITFGLALALGVGGGDLVINVNLVGWIILGYAVATAPPVPSVERPATA